MAALPVGGSMDREKDESKEKEGTKGNGGCSHDKKEHAKKDGSSCYFEKGKGEQTMQKDRDKSADVDLNTDTEGEQEGGEEEKE